MALDWDKTRRCITRRFRDTLTPVEIVLVGWSRMNTKSVATCVALWFAVAATVVVSRVLTGVPPPVIALGLATLATLLAFTVPALRDWVRTVDLRVLVAPHLIRFVGVVFLLLVDRGVLVPEFIPIGWGDLASAIGASALLLAGAPAESRSTRWWVWLGWNTFGLADMILVIVTGIRLATSAPGQFVLFGELPFALLPTFAVPLIITSHLLIFSRLFALRARAAA